MENTFTIEGLWAYIQSLSLSQSNKEWLISKLQEPANRQEEVEELPVYEDEEQLIAELLESKKEYENGDYIPFDTYKKQIFDQSEYGTFNRPV